MSQGAMTRSTMKSFKPKHNGKKSHVDLVFPNQAVKPLSISTKKMSNEEIAKVLSRCSQGGSRVKVSYGPLLNCLTLIASAALHPSGNGDVSNKLVLETGDKVEKNEGKWSFFDARRSFHHDLIGLEIL